MKTIKNGVYQRTLVTLIIISCCMIFTRCSPGSEALQVYALTIEGRDTLLGTDLQAPRLIWATKPSVQKVAVDKKA